MGDKQFVYSAGSVFKALRRTFHQYLEAQYHIWDERVIAERRALLESPGVSYQLPYLEATPHYAPGKEYPDLAIPKAARDILALASTRGNSGIPRVPYAHQAEALEAFLGVNQEIIVATGTGSGKTESFLMPIVGALAVESSERPASWQRPGVRALLLYPMNALVNDQISRLRRLLGDAEVSGALQGHRKRLATFGMYTGRTPYPGYSTPAKDEQRVGALLKRLFVDLTDEARQRLKREGKWPAKDISAFLKAFETGANDAELFTRHEMQANAPDLLVTNYSMLEYMLLRPLERGIFDQTAQWLASDPENCFIVVLDEAHMYRGAGGAEVAYLLRRLHSRLGIDRNRIRYILTSASLGSSDEARKKITKFAGDLTGHGGHEREFALITGRIELRGDPRPATRPETDALATFDLVALHRVHEGVEEAANALMSLASKIGHHVESSHELPTLQNEAYQLLRAFGPAALIGNLITSKPMPLAAVASHAFPNQGNAGDALEALLALMSFARERDTGRVFLPVRAHLLFRGLPGLYSCVDPRCRYRLSGVEGAVLGKLFSTPRLRCDCGARVYELFTHRDCGAAYIRGFLKNEAGDFLWHEKSSGLWSDLELLEGHFLVEVDRRFRGDTITEGMDVWLHCRTGLLKGEIPTPSEAGQYVALVRPDGLVTDQNRQVLSFNRACPVCVRKWQGRSKIMDLATKGEAPFAHLVREQVATQPQTQRPTDQSPNGGRKSLLFSDGRQRAARLARDIPREIEQDVFRQVLLLAAQELKNANCEPVLSHWMYAAFISVLSRTGLQLFDGRDRADLQRDVRAFREWHDNDLNEAIRELGSTLPARYSALLLRQLGSRFYSVNALTLGFIQPSTKALAAIERACPEVSKEHLVSLAVEFVQSLLDSFAFDAGLRSGVRHQAAGYPVASGISLKTAFTPAQQRFLVERLGSIDPLLKAFEANICESTGDAFFISPKRVRLEIGTNRAWFQCNACTATAPVTWWGHCTNCLSPGAIPVNPEDSSYLRARKGFWRDPVIRALSGKEVPLNLTVEEHTAQLSYRDLDDPSSTTEDFERRFKDILISPVDTSIDVLSSTTTMEVGIDIGSLVAIGLRNIPPMRQNYQQRAGRAGRRGSAVSTVVTYAQNSPHDNHYFENPEPMIAGQPSLPSVDTNNERIIERHIRAQLIQSFFHSRGPASVSSNIFSMLGDTWDFFTEGGRFSFEALRAWLVSTEAQDSFAAIRLWLPSTFRRDPAEVATDFVASLHSVRPKSEDEIEQSDEGLIEFLFSHGFLPSYAFPRDLCALQIEAERTRGSRTRILQRPQQGLNVALSEYAPGRLVVIDKDTYRVGSVAASGTSVVVNRAERLFSGRRTYVHCTACLFTAGFLQAFEAQTQCPLCRTGSLKAVTVIRPEVVYPDGGKQVDEYDDEQVFSQATAAQLPLPERGASFDWKPFLKCGKIAFARSQSLVMVNKGSAETGHVDGFLVCSHCGKTSLTGKPLGAHARDYQIDPRAGVPPPPALCTGEFHQVYLGYSFASDILLLRLPIQAPFKFAPNDKRDAQPLSDALQSLCEGLVIAVGRELDIDIREMSAGYRFVRDGDDYSADIFLYDTLSGGAGYATQAGAVFPLVFDELEKLLSRCTCSASCDKCLRHYGNRFHHQVLDRFLAQDLVRFVRSGEAPQVFDLDEQRTFLAPLVEMLELAGWTKTTDSAAAISVEKGAKRVQLSSFPSLVSPAAVGFISSSSRKAFSPYEIARDLPGAFSEVA